jgi:CO/xanthine dehydrogenase FAD-binding subunit
VRSRETEALTPASEAEAIEQFGGGSNVTVLAGGTILMPEVTYGRYPKGGRTLMLHRAGLDAVADNGAVTFGAIGGNLCGSPGVEAPRGDLQAPLVAMGARVRSAGAGGERTEPVEETTWPAVASGSC